jgi:SAM-dependent methyltransferase
MTVSTPMTNKAERWGRRWGSWAEAWAATEEKHLPTYEEAIRRLAIGPGQRVLDIGCGAGVFLRAAADAGADVAGVDASEGLLELSRSRVPDADLRLGDMQALPFDDDSFDAVTGFNSFFFADDMVVAIREAGRVAKPGAPVLIQVWGRPEKCDLTAMKPVVGPYMPAPPPDAPAPPPLWKPGVLEEIAGAAGLTPVETFDVSYPFEYENDESLGRGILSAGGVGATAGPDREPELRAALVDALAPYRTSSGGYRLVNEWHYLVARA